MVSGGYALLDLLDDVTLKNDMAWEVDWKKSSLIRLDNQGCSRGKTARPLKPISILRMKSGSTDSPRHGLCNLGVLEILESTTS